MCHIGNHSLHLANLVKRALVLYHAGRILQRGALLEVRDSGFGSLAVPQLYGSVINVFIYKSLFCSCSLEVP